MKDVRPTTAQRFLQAMTESGRVTLPGAPETDRPTKGARHEIKARRRSRDKAARKSRQKNRTS